MDNLMEEYFNYNPDEDVQGSRGGGYGIILANRIHQRFGPDRSKLNITLKRLERAILSNNLTK